MGVNITSPIPVQYNNLGSAQWYRLLPQEGTFMFEIDFSGGGADATDQIVVSLWIGPTCGHVNTLQMFSETWSGSGTVPVPNSNWDYGMQYWIVIQNNGMKRL
jgi:hypothetical protein